MLVSRFWERQMNSAPFRLEYYILTTLIITISGGPASCTRPSAWRRFCLFASGRNNWIYRPNISSAITKKWQCGSRRCNGEFIPCIRLLHQGSQHRSQGEHISWFPSFSSVSEWCQRQVPCPWKKAPLPYFFILLIIWTKNELGA